MEIISESTGITIGLAFALVGGVIWLTKLHMDVVGLTRKIDEIEVIQKEDRKLRIEMRETLIRIEGTLERLVEDVKKIKGS